MGDESLGAKLAELVERLDRAIKHEITGDEVTEAINAARAQLLLFEVETAPGEREQTLALAIRARLEALEKGTALPVSTGELRRVAFALRQRIQAALRAFDAAEDSGAQAEAWQAIGGAALEDYERQVVAYAGFQKGLDWLDESCGDEVDDLRRKLA